MTNRIGKVGRVSEKNTAKRLGGKLTPASGAAMHKGDIVLADFLVEAKSSIGSSLGIKYDWLVKIATEAAMTGKTPALSVTFTNDQGVPLPDGKWVLIRECEFSDLQSMTNRES